MKSIDLDLTNTFVMQKHHLTEDPRTDDLLQIVRDIGGSMPLCPQPPGSISKTVMNDVLSAPIGDFENTLSFPREEK